MVDRNSKTYRQANFETITMYMMSLAIDLILRNNEWLMSKHREAFKQEKKQLFNRYTKTVRDACILQDMLTQDIYDCEADHNYRNVDTWLDQANELVRLVLLYADRSADQDVVDNIFKFIREQPAEGIVDEQLLDNFRLKKL